MDTIIRAAITDQQIMPLLEAFERESNSSFGEVVNRIAVEVAHRFLDGRLSYDDADGVANDLFVAMLDAADSRGEPIAEPAYSIFQAFDAGEYDRGDGQDPVVAYTIPGLRSVLQRDD